MTCKLLIFDFKFMKTNAFPLKFQTFCGGGRSFPKKIEKSIVFLSFL
ncbi:hypothetical protein HMPREF9413_0025 [Paenibacillus sp. HGF7]|nr:hypothetical protein HMPREF9413_0025 [Paenibacillus sp. HGF7]